MIALAPSLHFRLHALEGSRVSAHPVIEIEKHRRALGRRDEQILKLAHRAGANRVAHVGGNEPFVRALVCKYVEMIEPEIFHHCFELPLAVDRAVHFRHGELGDDAIWSLDFCELIVGAVKIFVSRREHLRQRVLALLLHFFLIFVLRHAFALHDLPWRRKFVEKLG